MELFFIGIIIVALMVYASTKIKKNAALAFEREVIETEEFSLIKPEGLMHPLRDKSEFAFEAFSKDFGDEDLRNYWQANVELLVYSGKQFNEICAAAKASAENINSDRILKEKPSNQRICLIEGEQVIDEVTKAVYWKIVESTSRKKVYEFRVFVLKKNVEDFSFRVFEMLESFTVK